MIHVIHRKFIFEDIYCICPLLLFVYSQFILVIKPIIRYYKSIIIRSGGVYLKRILHANIFAMILVLTQLLGNLLLAPIYHIFTFSTPVLIVLTQFLFLIVPTMIYFGITKSSVKEVLQLHRLGWLNFIILCALGICIQPFAMFLSAIASLFFNNDVAALVGQLNSIPWFLMIVVTAITPAICEEVTLRGVVLSGHKHADIKKVAILNGLLFAILHFNAQQFLYTFALGILFVYVIHLTGSIYASMLLHFIVNASQITLSRIVMMFTEQQVQSLVQISDSIDLTTKLIGVGSTLLIALFFIPIVVVLLYALINVNAKRLEEVARQNFLPSIEDAPHISFDQLQTALEEPKEKLMNWPVYVTIAVYILYLAIDQVARLLL